LEKKIVSQFDKIYNREGTESEKYDSRERLFKDGSITPLWVADMDLPSPTVVIEAIAKRLQHPILGYTEQSDELRQSVQWWLRSIHKVEVDAQRVKFSPSVVTTFSQVILSCSEMGDSVVFLSPIYGPFRKQVIKAGRKPCSLSLEMISGKYEINFEKLEELFVTEKPSLFLFCSPHNPSGRVWSRGELENLVSLCKKYGVTLFSDDIHSDLVFDSSKHISLLEDDFSYPKIVVAHSIGKSFNCSGLNSSYWISKDADLEELIENQFAISGVEDINLLGKVAMKAAFSEEGKAYRRELLGYLAENVELVSTQFERELSNLTVIKPEAGYLIWIDFSATGLTHREVQAKLIQEASVGLSSGLAFGGEGKLFFRLNCALPRETLSSAVDRIIEFFK
jgi:cysteine-S-conjugate beta-lyase